MKQVAWLSFFVVLGCTREAEIPVPVTSTAAADTLELTPPEPSGDLAAAPIALPADWQGTGVLERRTVPAGAPEWAAVVAQVIERDGQRLLVTTGVATGIKNQSLLRTAAEARARAQIARWTKSQLVQGAQITDTYQDQDSGALCAKAEIVVPASWKPGTPL